jgi:RNase P subunit RPR2
MNKYPEGHTEHWTNHYMDTARKIASVLNSKHETNRFGSQLITICSQLRSICHGISPQKKKEPKSKDLKGYDPKFNCKGLSIDECKQNRANCYVIGTRAGKTICGRRLSPSAAKTKEDDLVLIIDYIKKHSISICQSIVMPPIPAPTMLEPKIVPYSPINFTCKSCGTVNRTSYDGKGGDICQLFPKVINIECYKCGEIHKFSPDKYRRLCLVERQDSDNDGPSQVKRQDYDWERDEPLY